MRTTIDKAGRVVIPAWIRDRAGLTPGTELEVSDDELGVRLQRVAPGPRLVRIGRRLVARPTVASTARAPIDIAALVEDERNRWRRVAERIPGGLESEALIVSPGRLRRTRPTPQP